MPPYPFCISIQATMLNLFSLLVCLEYRQKISEEILYLFISFSKAATFERRLMNLSSPLK